MLKSNISILSKAVLIATLGVGAVACSSQKEDAEARGDIETPTTPQDEVVEKVTENNETKTMEATESESIDPADKVSADVNEAKDTTENETNEVEADESKGIDVESSEATTDAKSVDTEANDNVIDGTEKEENVSTY